MGTFQQLRSWKSNKIFQNFLKAKFYAKYKPIKLFLFFQRLLS